MLLKKSSNQNAKFKANHVLYRVPYTKTCLNFGAKISVGLFVIFLYTSGRFSVQK